MIAVHEIIPCVRPDDGVWSDWLEVEQGLRQGAVLTLALQKFSKDADILAKLANLNEPPTLMGTEPDIDYIRRAVWGHVCG